MSFGDRTPYHAIDESHLEMLALHAFALAADVQLIAAQPMRLSYEFEGNKRRYTPDIYLRTDSEAVLVEVKELHTLLRPEDIEKHAARADAVRQIGGRLCFITDDVLKGCGGALARNLLRLQRPLRLQANDAYVELTHRLLKNESLSIMDLMLALDQPIGCILNMLAHKRLAFDWTKDITPESNVSLPGYEFRLLTTAELLNAGEFGDLLAELTLGRVPKNQRRLYRATAPRSIIKIRDPFGNIG
ncbi:TnsA endonuclease N-terminal domain-containing protein [Cupriavidus sp. USMAHM13]|uniref:TnsA endonuclease N-terminal domain-containing protein n=1 Tax=Cupriavidus sp. USMAHM13 TaxID=1389192 RepID=UPI0018D4AE94|nr:TnsA endonuclease N-terminal domain-containing protein [Cupriavidus sp. USMAHM13]